MEVLTDKKKYSIFCAHFFYEIVGNTLSFKPFRIHAPHYSYKVSDLFLVDKTQALHYRIPILGIPNAISKHIWAISVSQAWEVLFQST